MRHLLIFPALNGCVDFEKQEQEIANLLPQILSAAQNGQDVTFSTWRRNFGFGDPANFTLPSGDAFQVKLFCPMNGPEGPFPPDNWGQVIYHNSRRQPVDAGRFIVSGEGLRRQLELILGKQEFIDSLRQINSRPRLEVWVRWGMKMSEVAPDVHPVPRWMQVTAGLDPAAAAAKLNQLRHITTASEYQAKVRKDREAREREAQAEEDRIFEERRQAWLAEHAAEQEVRAYVDGLAGTHTAAPAQAEAPAAASAPPDITSPVPPEKTQRELAAEGRKKREKHQRIARNAVEAARKDKAAAEAHAQRVISRLEKEGRL
jgi:hypothetical protein